MPNPGLFHGENGVPYDAKVLAAILFSMGVEQWDPRVINQLMELTHRAKKAPIMKTRRQRLLFFRLCK